MRRQEANALAALCVGSMAVLGLAQAAWGRTEELRQQGWATVMSAGVITVMGAAAVALIRYEEARLRPAAPAAAPPPEEEPMEIPTPDAAEAARLRLRAARRVFSRADYEARLLDFQGAPEPAEVNRVIGMAEYVARALGGPSLDDEVAGLLRDRAGVKA